jgi:hypothetical protein
MFAFGLGFYAIGKRLFVTHDHQDVAGIDIRDYQFR